MQNDVLAKWPSFKALGPINQASFIAYLMHYFHYTKHFSKHHPMQYTNDWGKMSEFSMSDAQFTVHIYMPVPLKGPARFRNCKAISRKNVLAGCSLDMFLFMPAQAGRDLPMMLENAERRFPLLTCRPSLAC